MNILYMGTPDIAKEVLQALIDSHHTVSAVISQPDKPQGRHKELLPTPVKEIALKNKIEVYQPQTLKDGEILPFLERINPDIIVVTAYGKILPEYVLNYPKYRCINVHASLLPRYRGAAPIQRAIIDGEKETGVTIMYMEKGLDTGDMILQGKVSIEQTDNAQTLHDKLAKIGAKTLLEALELIENDKVNAVKQDDSLSNYAKMLTKEEGNINWNDTSENIYNLIRGLNPWPMAYSYLNGARFIVFSAKKGIKQGKSGEILSADKNGLEVACKEGSIIIEEVKFEGKKKMKISDYLLGHKIDTNTVLGDKN